MTTPEARPEAVAVTEDAWLPEIVETVARRLCSEAGNDPDGLTSVVVTRHDGTEDRGKYDRTWKLWVPRALHEIARSTQDHGGEANEMIGEVERLRAELKRLAAENDILRASTANGPGPCVYCTLPRSRWAECDHGFPGCPRGDDAMLCPHVGAELETADKLADAETRAAKAVEVLRRPEVQWGATYYDEQGCPVCSGSSGSHMTGCELAAVISENPGSALELEVVKEARFLLERIRELGSDALTEDGYRDFAGHVAPSMACLATLLSDHPAPEPGVEAGEVRRAALEEAALVCDQIHDQLVAPALRGESTQGAAIRALQTPADGGRDA